MFVALQVKIPDLETPPEPLNALFSGEHMDSGQFLAVPRKYNQAFAMTSFGTSGKPVRFNGWQPTFKVQGQVSSNVSF